MKVCLIGNNLTSLILAYILSKKKINTEIYSTKTSTFNFKTRTLGITEHNLNYLANYFENIYQKINPINKIKVFVQNEKIKEEILFNKNSIPLFNMIKYEKFVFYLKSKIKKNRYIEFKYFKKKSDLISLVNKKSYKLIINCERSNILTERFLNKGIFKNYYNKAFTTIINHKKIKNNTAIQIFTKYGPIAYLPLSEKLTSVVFSFERNKKNEIKESEILKIINEFNPSYKIISSEKFESFNLNLKLPKKYYYKNILFFGDSIHSIHPLAGQGFNMTIRDIIKFNKILDEKINLGLIIDKNIYKEFEKVAKSYNSMFSFGIDFIHEFFRFNKNFVPQYISKKIFKYISKNKKIKELGIKFANQGNL